MSMAMLEEKKVRDLLTNAQMSLHDAKDPREICELHGQIKAYKNVLIDGVLKEIPRK
jgi:hypothetical protein